MIRRDMDEVLAIERASFDDPWMMEQFAQVLRQRNCIGMVAELLAEGPASLVGFMIYELFNDRLQLSSLAIHPHFRMQGVARKMIDKMKAKITGVRRNRITLEIRESNLAAQKWLRQLDFRAIAVLRGWFEDTHEDAYRFEWRRPDFIGSDYIADPLDVVNAAPGSKRG